MHNEFKALNARMDKIEAQTDKIPTINKVSSNLKHLASWLVRSDSSLKDYIKSKTEMIVAEMFSKISPNPEPETAEREVDDDHDDDFMIILEPAKKRKRGSNFGSSD